MLQAGSAHYNQMVILEYEKDAVVTQFAGNISAAVWASMGGVKQKYEFVYEYDANGNMTKDHRLSKDIRYNLLNLPRETEFAVSDNSSKVIRYTYTASGQKISQQLMEDAGESVRRDYAGPFVYVNDTLAWINTPHSRIINWEG